MAGAMPGCRARPDGSELGAGRTAMKPTRTRGRRPSRLPEIVGGGAAGTAAAAAWRVAAPTRGRGRRERRRQQEGALPRDGSRQGLLPHQPVLIAVLGRTDVLIKRQGHEGRAVRGSHRRRQPPAASTAAAFLAAPASTAGGLAARSARSPFASVQQGRGRDRRPEARRARRSSRPTSAPTARSAAR